MFRKLIGISASALALTAAGPAVAAFVVTVEAPKATNTTSTFYYVGVENFDSRSAGTSTFSTTFGTGGSISGTYTNATIANPDLYGAAGGTGEYVVDNNGSYTIDLTTTNPGGINYFGYWLSALNSGNVVTFYNGATQVASYDSAALASAISGNSAYNGNPSGQYAGQNSGEQYAFLNFYDQGGSFNRVVISGAGHESDNHTVGNFASITGTILSGSVPEPASWAMMISGFGMIGAALRRHQRRQAKSLSQ